MIQTKVVNVLIVEDNRIDARLISHALKQIKDWELSLLVIEDGEQAITHLLNEPAPDLVILDLNLPGRDGTEILRAIRKADRHKDLPVFVLSSAPHFMGEDQIRKARTRADAYFAKPFEVGTFFDVARGIYKRFLEIKMGSHRSPQS
jgi:CheY-like chemotaxis protein